VAAAGAIEVSLTSGGVADWITGGELEVSLPSGGVVDWITAGEVDISVAFSPVAAGSAAIGRLLLFFSLLPEQRSVA